MFTMRRALGARKARLVGLAIGGAGTGVFAAVLSDGASAADSTGRWTWPTETPAFESRDGYASRVGGLKDEGAYKVGRKVRHHPHLVACLWRFRLTRTAPQCRSERWLRMVRTS